MFNTKPRAPRDDNTTSSPGDTPLETTKATKEAAPPKNRRERSKESASPRNRSKRVQTASGKSQRRMARLGLLLIVSVLGLGGGFLMLHRSTSTTPVYIAVKGIPSGAVVIPSDIGVEQVPLPGIPNALSLNQILNNRASVAILPGEVLTNGLATSQSVPNGQEVIGVTLTAGHMPNQGLTTGTSVEIIYTSLQPLSQSVTSSTPAHQSLNAAPGTILGTAVVSSVTQGSNGSNTLVDLILPTKDVPVTTTAAANNDISLARRS